MLLPYRACLTASCILFTAGPAFTQENQPLEARLRELEKAIAAVRNLEFKEPVRAKVIARAADADKRVQGYYSPKEKTLYLYNDLAGNYEKGVLIHEMVHALQDQHFNLSKLKATLHAAKFGSDADLALAALIEGDATYTMIEVLKNEQPKVAAMLDMPLAKAKNLQNAFLYAQGARYVKALKDKGGWANVNFAYKFPPRSTASVFNLHSVATIDLGPGPSKGPFALWKEMASQADTKPMALALAKAWRGDRLVKYPDGEASIIACASQTDAIRLLESLWRLHGAADSGLAISANEASWRQSEGPIVAGIARDARVILVRHADAQASQTILDRLFGPPQVTVHAAKDKKNIAWGDFIDRLLETDVVCIGEDHDSELHHQVQHHLVKALYSRDERLAVGMEMFQKPYQAAIDKYFRGESGEEEFLRESEYPLRWGYDWSLYRPVVEFCRRNQLPLAALNAPKELTRRISMVGYAALDAREKLALGLIDFELKEHRAHWFPLLGKMHGDTKASPERKEQSYQVMAVWDDFMARTAAEFIKERKVRRLVVIAGSGHVERGFGIPNRVARYAGRSVATIGVRVAGEEKEKQGEILTDYVVTVR